MPGRSIRGGRCRSGHSTYSIDLANFKVKNRKQKHQTDGIRYDDDRVAPKDFIDCLESDAKRENSEHYEETNLPFPPFASISLAAENKKR